MARLITPQSGHQDTMLDYANTAIIEQFTEKVMTQEMENKLAP